MEQNWMALLEKQQQLTKVLEMNECTEKYGLSLTKEQAEIVLAERKHALKEQRRVEFGEGIVTKIIQEFCDSAYIDQNTYVDTLVHLQEIFYLYKNEMEDEITDDELLHFMKEQFETICFGDLEYLEGTCLAIFAEAIRAGYRDFHASDGYGDYTQFDVVPRWDHELYEQALLELQA